MLLEFRKCLFLSAWRGKKLTSGFLPLTRRDITSTRGREDAVPSARTVKLGKGFFQSGRKRADPSAVPELVQPLGWLWCCEKLWKSLCKGLCKRRGALLSLPHAEAKVKGHQGALVPSWKQHIRDTGASRPWLQPPSLTGGAWHFSGFWPCFAVPTQGMVLSTHICALLHQGPQQWG